MHDIDKPSGYSDQTGEKHCFVQNNLNRPILCCYIKKVQHFNGTEFFISNNYGKSLQRYASNADETLEYFLSFNMKSTIFYFSVHTLVKFRNFCCF